VTNIIIALPRQEDSINVKNLLVRNGFSVVAICTTGAQALSQADGLNDGIVVCGYKMTDMIYDELHDCLPEGFQLLLLASQNLLTDCIDNNIMCLAMPLKVHDLLNTISMMSQSIEMMRKKRKVQPKERKPEEVTLINEAKCLLMSRNNMTEDEAHRYIQKSSMDSSTNMVETAQMILAVMRP